MNYKEHQLKKKKAQGTEPANIYFRSSVNNWSTANQFYKYADNCYICRAVYLPTGEHEFKIADENYSDINFGSVTNKVISKNRYHFLDKGTNNNAKLSIKKDAKVDIFLMLVNDNMQLLVK